MAASSSVALVLAWAALFDSPTLGDDLTRYTVRLSLLFYAPAMALMLFLRQDEWTAERGRGPLARLCWSLALAIYLVHVALAFHYHHGWSHAEAVAHVESRSGFGPGIFVSYLFTLIWAADVVRWWTAPASYAARPAWVGRTLHGFMLFVIFNATVVYESGPIRWAGLLLFAVLAVLVGVRRKRLACESPPGKQPDE